MRKMAEQIIEEMGTTVGEVGSFDINEEQQFFVEVDGDEDGKFYHLELIHKPSTDILESSCCDIDVDKLEIDLQRLVDNHKE